MAQTKSFKFVGSTTANLGEAIRSLAARSWSPRIPPQLYQHVENEVADRAVVLLNNVLKGIPLKTAVTLNGSAVTEWFDLTRDYDDRALVVGAQDLLCVSNAALGLVPLYYSFQTEQWSRTIGSSDDMPASVLNSTQDFVRWERKIKNQEILDRGDEVVTSTLYSPYFSIDMFVKDPSAIPSLMQAWGEEIPECLLNNTYSKSP